ncbi:MAG: hypothetical protein FD174_3327 [Geobacteraceae bacterium]|nr:MAG: hypothetical protein FD174_3327 [Geobacteraceae bacterium]
MKTIATIVLAVMLSAANVWAGSVGNAIEVRIVTDDGRTLPTYPVKTKHDLKKVYAEAVKGEHYRIEVRNRLNRRVGLVIAVDGRNIISGEKSWLKSSERMYILEPYGSGEFAGWRTGQERINRFYFTDVPDSYAAAFGDESAMGVITVAAYPEVLCHQPPPFPMSQQAPTYERGFGGRGDASSGAADLAGAAPAAPAARSEAKKAAKSEQALDGAGTGYGREEYSPVETVAFEAENRAVETIHFKYEWRSTLCRLGVVSCDMPHRRPPNRLWDNGGFAPPPPGRS